MGRSPAQETDEADCIVVRYAEDLVVGFESRVEAKRFLKGFREGVAHFGLELHTEKTRLIEFGRFAAQDRKRRGKGKPETFTFLGFTHYCGKRRKDGAFIVGRETAKKRIVAKLKAIKPSSNTAVTSRPRPSVPGSASDLRLLPIPRCSR
jgi:RNA-directed DNA polymerase